MAQDETPKRARQATKRGNTRGILIVSLVIVVLALGGALFFIGGQDTEDAADGVVVDPDTGPVEEDGGADPAAVDEAPDD